MKRKIKLPSNKKRVHFSIDVTYEQQKKTTDLPTPTPSSSIKYIKLDLKPKSILKMQPQTSLPKTLPPIQHPPPLIQSSSYPSRNKNISSLLSAYSFQTAKIHPNALSPPSTQLKRPYKKARAINYNKTQTAHEKGSSIKTCLLHHIRTRSTCTYTDYSSIILNK